MIAVAAFDPGDTTGAAFLIATKEAVLKYTPMQNPEPDPYLQAKWVLNTWLAFRTRAYMTYDIPPDDHYIVMEDFLPPAQVRSTQGRFMNSIRIIYLFEGMRIGCQRAYEERGLGPTTFVPMVLQKPAHRVQVSDARLRRAGYWTRGQEHARAATQHALLFLMRKGHANVLSPNSRPQARV